jgi:hypothetical protein
MSKFELPNQKFPNDKMSTVEMLNRHFVEQISWRRNKLSNIQFSDVTNCRCYKIPTRKNVDHSTFYKMSSILTGLFFLVVIEPRPTSHRRR